MLLAAFAASLDWLLPSIATQFPETRKSEPSASTRWLTVLELRALESAFII